MELTNVFERAAMNKYRFPYKGQISVEDLWDLSLPGLDSVFKQLNKLKKANEVGMPVLSEQEFLDMLK